MLIGLDDGRALNPAVVGAKAAGLARARRAGLPVLPGVVVPAGEDQAARALGREVLAARGSGGARLAVMQAGVEPRLSQELARAASRLGERLVVRSSSPVEGEGVWSGAFASYAELTPSEVSRGVAGCWASLFTPDALSRTEATGRRAGEVAMAVLIQPEIRPSFGGVATVGEGRPVEVVGVAGSPASLVAGWEKGHRAYVEDDGRVTGAGAAALDHDLLQAVARLTRDARLATGGTTIEWATDPDGLWLLQVLPSDQPTHPRAEEPPSSIVHVDPRLASLVRVLIDHPGPLGEDLVLPWALGWQELPAPLAPAGAADPSALLAEARHRAGELAAGRWGSSPQEARSRAADLLRTLRGPAPSGAFEVIDRLAPADPEEAARVLGCLQALEQRLVEEHRIPKAAWLRHLEIAEIELLCAGAGPLPGRRIGRGRWEPFLVSAVEALGAPLPADPVVPGTGAGRVRVVHSALDAEAAEPREVLVATHPLHYLAPLLWECAALATLAGSPAAHLFEVAASLGVPTVCALQLDGGLTAVTGSGRTAVASVDGSSGRFHLAWM